MKRESRFITAATAVLFLITSIGSATADITPSPTATVDSFKVAQEQYRKDRDAYMVLLRERDLKLRAINTTFKSAIEKAATDAKIALLAATSPDQKNAINSVRRAAITAAIVARESAIAELAPLPAPPLPPMKPAKDSQLGNPGQKGKQKR
jgi:hypothetical protein